MDDSICFNADLDRIKVSNELNRQLGMDIKPDETYLWIFYHELGHKLGMGESWADLYANKHFFEWKAGAGG